MMDLGPRLKDLDSMLVTVSYMGETHGPAGPAASSYQMQGGEGTEPTPHRTATMTLSALLRRGGYNRGTYFLIESACASP